MANAIITFINTPIESNTTACNRLLGYYTSVKHSLAKRMGELVSTDEVSLPSPAVFMEPVLSQAKGAELYDMRRNSHYEVLSAPGIGVADPNVDRSESVTLTPTVPGSTLAIQSAPEFPLPNSLSAALAEAGKLDLSTLINSNAGTLNTTLSNLSDMATELAKASTQLTGDAQKQALASASDVAKQVGDIVNKSLQTPAAAPPAPKPAPPQGQQSKAEVVRELERINQSKGTENEKKEKKESIGAPVAPVDTLNYELGIVFLDENGIPYEQGDFSPTMTFFEFPDPVYINDGKPIPMERGQFRFGEPFFLKKGRLATLRIDATIAGVTIPGAKDFRLPDGPDILFKCRMKSAPPEKVTATNVRNAVDEKLRTSTFGAGINPLFQQFLNAGIALPFKIFEVKADGGEKTELNLKLEYNSTDSDTTTETSGETTVKEYEVVLPLNGWEIEVISA